MLRHERTLQISAVISRVNALRVQLFRPELDPAERMEILMQVARWRMRLAVMLQPLHD